MNVWCWIRHNFGAVYHVHGVARRMCRRCGREKYQVVSPDGHSADWVWIR